MEEESNDALCNKGDFVLSAFSILIQDSYKCL